jgi:hypothetical protein
MDRLRENIKSNIARIISYAWYSSRLAIKHEIKGPLQNYDYSVRIVVLMSMNIRLWPFGMSHYIVW